MGYSVSTRQESRDIFEVLADTLAGSESTKGFVTEIYDGGNKVATGTGDTPSASVVSATIDLNNKKS